MHVTIRWTEAVDRPLPDGKFTRHRSVIGAVTPLKMRQQLSRIKEKLGDRTSQLNPRLTAAQVREFEQLHRVKLPEDYRAFLIHIGNGGIGPPDYGMYALGTTETQPQQFRQPKQQDLIRINEPFPFTKYWVWENGETSIEGTEEQIRDGSILLGTDGCGMYWHLIVKGPERGIPWMICGEGIQPVCPKRNFLQWYEDWLDGLDHFYGFVDNKE